MSDKSNINGNESRRVDLTPSPKVNNTYNIPLSQRKRNKGTQMLPKSPILPLQGYPFSGNEVLAKKRLVEQFYMPRSDPPLKAQSYSDLVSTFRQGLPGAESPSREPRQEEALPWPQLNGKKSFMELAQEGKLEYAPMDRDVKSPAKVVEMLLGVDNEEDDTRVLDQLALTLESSALALERRFEKDVEMTYAPTEQLDMLEEYLNKLSKEVDTLHQELSETTLRLKSNFKLQLQVSVEKLEKLDELLKSLTVRLEESRQRMKRSKEKITEEMAEKIAVLEYAARRFNEYDQLLRQRRVAQLTCFLCFLVAALSVFWFAKRFGLL